MKATKSLLQVFQSRKMAALLLLGVSSGLPLFLTSKTLQAWMTVEGVNLAAIGLFSLVGLPYSLKFIWAPLLDRFTLPFLGRRRGWLILIQCTLLVAIALMALQRPAQALQILAVNALAIAFLSATQDIAADAYRADVLEKREMGAGAAVFVLGYRIALLLTGSLALILADRVSWPSVYLLISAVMVIGIIGTVVAPEPKERDRPPASLADAVVLPFGEFFQRLGLLQGLLILLFIVLYKLGDALVNNMSTPFLLQTGFTQTDIGAIQGGMGLIATIVGALAGGVILSKIGINRSLWVFGGLQAVSNLAYFIQAQLGRDYRFMILTINIENFCAGLGTAAFVAFLMSLCNQRFSATQYALLSSLMAVSRDILVAPAGRLVEITGWPMFFIISILAAIPGLMLLPIFAPWNPKVLAVPRPRLDDDSSQL
ncbi:AmpG family muropeptide MFS transporter [Chroococcidiopsis sp. CCMEE 29]|uniref:AmpG family muropeptide MFS transporter n=1 Tax=Chroococcidiopsis sp. CCMEE 29 TaxID=155894 RepID=UPI002021B43F|nr:AmpG family muropeptide MFS transporter [Chroococcidiopsis sp. CCMEE 29]